ncbi:hypothetical protein BAE44_0021325 [Dichanthelium oligosanthes]|uniref:Uncharacterized protein n=1 Tax=Dichanthelium oligosanthes TaxID=888268 RepID=A0A1E5UXP2_9POAL|nr:hypothetical protein BAE44_0021325 [Dichanthelium oligosanthes]
MPRAAAAVAAPLSSDDPVEWLVSTRLAAAATDAAICLFLASLWLLFGGLAATEVGELACGEECPVVAAAVRVVYAAGATLPLVLIFGVVPMMAMRAADDETILDIEAAKVRNVGKLLTVGFDPDEATDPESLAAAVWEVVRGPIMLGILPSMPFVLLMFVGALLEGDLLVKVSGWEETGAVIFHVGVLGMHAVYCFLLCPILTVKILKSWRMP